MDNPAVSCQEKSNGGLEADGWPAIALVADGVGEGELKAPLYPIMCSWLRRRYMWLPENELCPFNL